MDMNARMNTMLLANEPMEPQSSSRDILMVSGPPYPRFAGYALDRLKSRCLVPPLVADVECNRHLHQHPHRLAAHPAGAVEALQHGVPGGELERLVGGLHHPQ